VGGYFTLFTNIGTELMLGNPFEIRLVSISISISFMAQYKISHAGQDDLDLRVVRG
jgi:hypothetical protein